MVSEPGTLMLLRRVTVAWLTGTHWETEMTSPRRLAATALP